MHGLVLSYTLTTHSLIVPICSSAIRWQYGSFGKIVVKRHIIIYILVWINITPNLNTSNDNLSGLCVKKPSFRSLGLHMPPPPQEGVGQLMDESPWEYLMRRSLKIANYFRMADKQEQEIMSSKSLVQVSHPLPTCPSPTVWIWEYDANNFPVKHGLN